MHKITKNYILKLYMNPLEVLKSKLKLKPMVSSNNGVRIILAPPPEHAKKNKPIITTEKDDGQLAQNILDKIIKNKLSAVVNKFPEEPKTY